MQTTILWLIDAENLVFQSCIAYKTPNRDKPAALRFAQRLAQIQQKWHPKEMAICFNCGEPFRRELWPEYRVKRDELRPPDYDDTVAEVRDWLTSQGVACYEYDGAESSDVIASLFDRHDGRVVAVSQQSSLRQLLIGSDRLAIMDKIHLDPDGDLLTSWYTHPMLIEKVFMVDDEVVEFDYIDWMCLVGHRDAAVGARGFGEVRSTLVLARYGDLETVREAMPNVMIGDRPANPSQVLGLEEMFERLAVTRTLVTLRRDLELPVLPQPVPDFRRYL